MIAGGVTRAAAAGPLKAAGAMLSGPGATCAGQDRDRAD